MEAKASMQTTCVAITNDGHFRKTETASALQRLSSGHGSFLIVADGGTPDEVIDWIRSTGLDPEIIDVFVKRGQNVKFLPLDKAIFFELPYVTTDNPDESFLSTFICVDRLVIQIRDSSAAPLEYDDFSAISKLSSLREASTSALICSLLTGESTVVRGLTLALQTRARRLATRMDVDPSSVALDEIVALKRSIRDLDETVSEQLAVMTLLKVVQGKVLDLVGIADLFQVAVANTESADRAIDRLAQQAADLQSRYDTSQQDKTNQRLAVLTVISAIYLPLTLVAGIYGMNFDIMPELHFSYAYPVTLAAMAVIAIGLYWYFRSRGWFGK